MGERKKEKSQSTTFYRWSHLRRSGHAIEYIVRKKTSNNSIATSPTTTVFFHGDFSFTLYLQTLY